VVRNRAPGALICLDAFHVVKWAGEKLDELRRRLAGARGFRSAHALIAMANFVYGGLCPKSPYA
jgi:transposase